MTLGKKTFVTFLNVGLVFNLLAISHADAGSDTPSYVTSILGNDGKGIRVNEYSRCLDRSCEKMEHWSKIEECKVSQRKLEDCTLIAQFNDWGSTRALLKDANWQENLRPGMKRAIVWAILYAASFQVLTSLGLDWVAFAAQISGLAGLGISMFRTGKKVILTDTPVSQGSETDKLVEVPVSLSPIIERIKNKEFKF